MHVSAETSGLCEHVPIRVLAKVLVGALARIGKHTPVGPREHEPSILRGNVVASFVDHAVMMAAQGDEVVESRLATIGPVPHVVRMDEARMVAARKAAASVAGLQGAPQRRRDRPGLAAHIERLAGCILDDSRGGAVAGHSRRH